VTRLTDFKFNTALPWAGRGADPDNMVERKIELRRRYHRKHKLAKLKAKLAAAKDQREKDHILRKIHVLSPWWTEPGKA
jgi:hypothetical protein